MVEPKQIITDDELALMDDDDIAHRLGHMATEDILADAAFRRERIQSKLKKNVQ